MNKYLHKVLRWCVFQMTDSKDHRVCTKETPPITTKTFDEDTVDRLTLNIQTRFLRGKMKQCIYENLQQVREGEETALIFTGVRQLENYLKFHFGK